MCDIKSDHSKHSPFRHGDNTIFQPTESSQIILLFFSVIFKAIIQQQLFKMFYYDEDKSIQNQILLYKDFSLFHRNFVG